MTHRRLTLLFLSSSYLLAACASLPKSADWHDPLSPAEHVKLADAYLTHGDKEAATAQLQLALHQDSRYVPALMAMGNLYFEDHKWKDSVNYFHRAWKVSPDNAGVINNLAMVDLAAGKDLAQDHHRIEQVLPKAGPAAPYLLDTLANIELREGRIADARRAWAQASKDAPSDDPNFKKNLEETRARLDQQK